MNRRTLLALLLALPAGLAHAAAPQAAALTAQDRADLSRIETYLNSLHALTARFLQVAPDGAITEGKAWLERPGRMRFEYDKPSPFLMVAGFGSFVFHDKELGQTTSVPLSVTPLGILLADQVKLEGSVTVTGIDRQPGQIEVSMTRTASPEDGALSLVFADNPLALRQWVVTDAQRQETRVSLFKIEPASAAFSDSLFQFEDPRTKATNKGN